MRSVLAVLTAGLVLASLVSCAASQREQGGGVQDTFVFGVAGAPKNFDPIFNDDGESFRPQRQMLETLIAFAPRLMPMSTAFLPKPRACIAS